MMTLIVLFALVGLILPAAAPAMPSPVAMQPGETVVFRVTWGMLGHAGDVVVTASAETNAHGPVTRIQTSTTSRGMVGKLYPFTGEAAAYYQLNSGRLLHAEARTEMRRRNTHATLTVNGPEATYVDHVRPRRNTTLELPETEAVADFITTLIAARSWGLRPGDTRDVQVLFDDELYELTLTARRVETVRGAEGRVRALLVVPTMKGEPRGIFRRGGSINLWLAEEGETLPVRFEVSMKVGTATGLLTRHERTPSAER